MQQRVAGPLEGRLEWLVQPLPRGNGNRLIAMLWCYLDDSGTDGTTPTVTMAGYVAPLANWRRFEIESRKHFKKHRIGFFHAKDLHHRAGDFRGRSVPDECAFLDGWLEIAGRHMMAGITMNVARQTYMAKRGRTAAWLNRSAYGHCFDSMLDLMHSDDEVGAAMIDHGISFFVESGNKWNAGVLDIFNRRKSRDGGGILQQLSFVDKHSCKAIQLADFLAFYTRRHSARFMDGSQRKMDAYLTVAKDRIRTIAGLAEDFAFHPRRVLKPTEPSS